MPRSPPAPDDLSDLSTSLMDRTSGREFRHKTLLLTKPRRLFVVIVHVHYLSLFVRWMEDSLKPLCHVIIRLLMRRSITSSFLFMRRLVVPACFAIETRAIGAIPHAQIRGFAIHTLASFVAMALEDGFRDGIRRSRHNDRFVSWPAMRIEELRKKFRRTGCCCRGAKVRPKSQPGGLKK